MALRSSRPEGHPSWPSTREFEFLASHARILCRPGLAPVSPFHGVGLRKVACCIVQARVYRSSRKKVQGKGCLRPGIDHVLSRRLEAAMLLQGKHHHAVLLPCFLLLSPRPKGGWTNATTAPWPLRFMLPGQCQTTESASPVCRLSLAESLVRQARPASHR